MPIVPRYQPNQVQRAPLQGGQSDVRVSSEAFGGGQANRAGAKLSDTADTFTKVVAQYRDQALKMKEDYFSNKLDQFYLQQNEEGGAFRTKGQEAFGADERLNKEFDSFVSEMDGEAVDEDQKSILGALSEKYRNKMRLSLSTHVAGEADKFYEETKKQTVANQESIAVLNYRDESAVMDSYKRTEDAIMRYGQYSGRAVAKPVIDPATGKQAIDKTTGEPLTQWEGPAAEEARQTRSKVLKSVLERHLANGDISGARSRLQGYDKKSMMTGDDVKSIEAQLDQKDKDYKATINAQAIIDRFTDEGAALEATSKLAPEIRDEVNRKVKIGIQQKNERNTLALESNFAEGLKYIANGGSYTTLKPAVKGAMLYDQQEALKAYENELSGVRTVKPDPKAYADFSSKSEGELAAMQPSEFISKYYLKATPAQRETMVAMRQNATKGMNGETNAKLQFDMKKQDQQLVLQAMKEAEIGDIPKNYTLGAVAKDKNKAAQFSALELDASNAITREQEIKNRKLSDDEKLKIIRRVALEKTVTVEGFFSDKKISAGAVTPEQISKVQVKPEYETMYINIAKANGVIAPKATPAQAKKILGDKLKAAYINDMRSDRTNLKARTATIVSALRGE